MMQAGTIRAWSWVHKWTSLISTLFLLMLCLTGLPLIFHDEIDTALNPESWQPAPPGGTHLTLEDPGECHDAEEVVVVEPFQARGLAPALHEFRH